MIALKIFNWTAKISIALLFVIVAIFLALLFFKMDVLNFADESLFWTYKFIFVAIVYSFIAYFVVIKVYFTRLTYAIVFTILPSVGFCIIVKLLLMLWNMQISFN
jgi:hypothetical protein